ncbi:uncharacterized protein EHS24_007349 [Apiotrichum porosum]|uniref:Aminotransferase class I/classII large domain-containing protein n=1 Tax=Apiotrichum porosum TaxID=105984 RepID=A0A427XU74_9TREE|nr:uncharacterized protein EHS24_007349 [Apiotrichum porosum]RSH82382.1 hypothetical protein EHS24_007349 [Apiotrichum porosum]
MSLASSLTTHVNSLAISDVPLKPRTPAPKPNPVSVGAWSDAVDAYAGPRLSKRIIDVPDSHVTAEKLDAIFRTTYDGESNPGGLINLGIAENSLLTQEYLEYYSRVLKDALTPGDLTYGNQSSGSSRLHTAIADLWNENFSPLTPVKPDDIVTGPGATSVLDQLVAVFLDPGDAILIAAPHYNGFNVNMVARSRSTIVSVPVPNEEAFSPTSLDYFETAIKEYAAKGVTTRAVMLCSPQNPYGRTYDKETLLAYALFAEKHDLHLISDELYALSVYDNPNMPDAPPFISMLALDIEKETGKPFDSRRLHVVYSFSKDFGVNGFRVAAVISQHNPLVLRALLHTAFLMKVSSPADALLSYLLNDKPTFRKMVALNQARLADSAAHVRDWFEKRGFKPFQSNAGHFMMVDGRDVFHFKNFEEERAFAHKCIDAGVVVGVGQSYHYAQPGWLRVTFSVHRPVLDLALQRLDEALKSLKN